MQVGDLRLRHTIQKSSDELHEGCSTTPTSFPLGASVSSSMKFWGRYSAPPPHIEDIAARRISKHQISRYSPNTCRIGEQYCGSSRSWCPVNYFAFICRAFSAIPFGSLFYHSLARGILHRPFFVVFRAALLQALSHEVHVRIDLKINHLILMGPSSGNRVGIPLLLIPMTSWCTKTRSGSCSSASSSHGPPEYPEDPKQRTGLPSNSCHLSCQQYRVLQKPERM
jgi:hypothetical protein